MENTVANSLAAWPTFHQLHCSLKHFEGITAPENVSLGRICSIRNDSSFSACPALLKLTLEVLDGDQVSEMFAQFSESEVCEGDEYCHITNEECD